MSGGLATGRSVPSLNTYQAPGVKSSLGQRGGDAAPATSERYLTAA